MKFVAVVVSLLVVACIVSGADYGTAPAMPPVDGIPKPKDDLKPAPVVVPVAEECVGNR